MAKHDLAFKGDDSSVESFSRRLLLAATELSEIGITAGYRIVPATNSSLPLFKAVSVDKQRQIVEVLEKICSIYQAVLNEKQNIRNASSVIWMAFKALDIVPPSDFFDKVSSDDVVEIYSSDGLHRFANFKFFELCSYTLEQIYTLPWTEMWSRPDSAIESIKSHVIKVLHPDQRCTFLVNDEAHVVTEISSPFKWQIHYRPKYFAPLLDKTSRTKVGFVLVEAAHLLTNVVLPEEEEAMLTEFYSKASPTRLRVL
jgi:hypothetical protein